MEQTKSIDLIDAARKVLEQNDRGTFTMPAGDLYPHQWLWDSCFIAIGLRWLNIERAQTELISLLRGQWANGMLPNIIFSEGVAPRHENLWRSWVSPYAPADIATSGITQPPLLAEAVVRIGQKMKLPERRSWYRQIYPQLLDFHQWIYADRDPHQEGLAILLHPYESGLDDSPPWISELRKHSMPKWIRFMERFSLGWVANLFRTDTGFIGSEQRMSNIEAMAYWAALRRLRRKAYNSEALLSRSLFAVEDLAFNCILIRANELLIDIAATIKQDIPEHLSSSMARSRTSIAQLWDETSGQYYSRSFVSHKLVEEATIATLLPLYSGAISHEKAEELVKLLNKSSIFGAKWPVPSVPLNSAHFSPFRYWQGPAWVNTNWLIIDGLTRYGFNKEATALKDRTIEMVAKGGMSEYFNPLTAQPAGALNFSWTAALAIDLLKS
jgi:hypothetical protein